jgi:hypothetical protein
MTNYDIIQSFRQGTVEEGGNCASIALIKAAISVFGIDNVFEYQKDNNVYTILLKDGNQVTFTQEQLDYTTLRAGFHLRQGNNTQDAKLYEQIYNYANLCFCTMVKRVTEIGESGDGIGDFENAIIALNDGATTPFLYKTLGLVNVQVPSIWLKTKGKKGIIAWKKSHTVYVEDGLYDHYGEAKKLGALFPNRMQILP